MFLRAFKICNTEYLHAEIKHLADIAKHPQSPQHFIDTSLKSAYCTFHNNDLMQTERITFNNILVVFIDF